MKLLLLISLTGSQFFLGYSIPFSNSERVLSDKYFHSRPYSKEQLLDLGKSLNLTLNSNPDELLDIPDLIKKNGYPAETHFTETSDGYILRLHRIPPKKRGVKPNNQVVFMMHGILMSSADWITMGPEQALAYYLADNGYDVWMGNARGNTQSRNHTTLNPDDGKFWKFTWHDIGTKDVPAMIDYTLKVTKKEALFHIGYSQGTTTFYVMCSELPSYNDKIIAHVSLAPVAFMQYAASPLLRLLSSVIGVPEVLAKLIGVDEFLPHWDFITWLGDELCVPGEMTEILCKDILFLIVGFDRAEFNETLLPLLLAHFPAGASVGQLFHYAQQINSGQFRQYDHFPFNALHYGPLHAIEPPSYDLNKIKVPVYLYHSNNDWMSHPKDVDRLCLNLGNCRQKLLVPVNKFNHLDFVLGVHAKERIYTDIVTKVFYRSWNEWQLKKSIN